MLPFAYYILKVIICSAVLYGYYWFFLRNKIFHSYNRFYLLATIALSLMLPLLKFNVWQKADAPKTSVVNMLQFVNSSDEYMDEVIIQSHYNHISKEEIAMWIFIAICFVFASIFTATIIKIYSLKKNNLCQQYNDISLVHTKDKRTPFSFLKNIFWNDEIDINSNNGKRILKHEVAHVQEKHSHDKLFINIALIFFWCNPIFWLIRRELNMIHEFIADTKAVEDGDTAAFAAMILHASYPGHRFELTNNFFYSPIKRRLSMLTKNKTKVGYISRLLVLPLIIIVFAAFTLKAKNYIASFPNSKAITVVIDAGHGGTDHGAISKDGILEKDLALNYAKAIKTLNTNENIKIILLRETDVYQDLKQKAVLANNLDADFFISIHFDNSPEEIQPLKSGMKVFVAKDQYSNSEKSKLLASGCIHSFQNNYGLAVSNTPEQRETGIWVLQESKCPAVLIEGGYMSNEKDMAYLVTAEGKEQFAKNVLNAISNFAMNRQKEINFKNVLADTSPVKKLSLNNNIAAKITNAKILTNTDGVISIGEGIISIEADTFEINSGNNASHEKDPLVIINNKECDIRYLVNKKLTFKRELFYPKDDPVMLKKYGTKAVNGVWIFENATMENLQVEKKQNSISAIDASNKTDTDGFIYIEGKDDTRLKRLINAPTDDQGHSSIYFVNGKQVVQSSLKDLNVSSIDHAILLLSFDAMSKYGEEGKYGAVEIYLKKVPSLTLSGINDSHIHISKLKDIQELKYDPPGYQVAYATVYFSGEGFPEVVQTSIYEGSLKGLEKFMQRIVAGTELTFDNVFISKPDGSGKIEIGGRSFGFYDKSITKLDKANEAYNVFTKVETEPAFPGADRINK